MQCSNLRWKEQIYEQQLKKCTRIGITTIKPVLSGHSIKNTKIGFQYRLSLNGGQKYCRMLQGEHSAILSTSIKLPFSIKILVLSIFKWPLKTGFTVYSKEQTLCPLGNFSCVFVGCWFKVNFLKNSFRNTIWVSNRSGPIWVWSGSDLFAKVISRWH